MSNSSSYAPSSLPVVSSIEIVALQDVEAKLVSKYMDAAAAAPCIRIVGRDTERLAKLWRRLPPGHQMRCHTPRIGLCFRSGERIVCQGSICWKCHNIYGDVAGAHFCYEFDADSKPSKTLLSEIRKLINAFDTRE
jgi:hypothetical protein